MVTGARLPIATRNRVQRFEFRFAFDIELMDAGLERGRHFARGLADAGKDDAVRRNAGGQRLLQFAARDDVGAGAEPRQRLQHRQIAVGLDRIGDQRVLRKGAGEDLVVALQRRRRIAIEGRAHAVRRARPDRRPRHAARRRGIRNGSSAQRMRRLGRIVLIASASFLPFGRDQIGLDAAAGQHQRQAQRVRRCAGSCQLSPARTGSVRARAPAPCRRSSCAH